MDYKNYSVEDLMADDNFISWVQAPTDDSNAYWSAMQKDGLNPHIQEARQLVLELRSAAPMVDQGAKNEVWAQLKPLQQPTHKTRSLSRYWSWAAAVVVAVLVSLVVLNQDNPLAVYENNQSIAMDITLPDQTIVSLEPQSILKVNGEFGKSDRSVRLSGKAYFDVERDTLRPFRIQAQHTLTEVLGTSFTITAYEKDEEVDVDVYTGKVAVYSSTSKEIREGVVSEVVLTPNQKAVFVKSTRELQKTVVAAPKLLAQPQQLRFDNRPVGEVFEAMKSVYGLDIKYDADLLAECTISTQLDDQSLPLKMQMIAEAIDVTIKEENAIYYVKGKGCK